MRLRMKLARIAGSCQLSAVGCRLSNGRQRAIQGDSRIADFQCTKLLSSAFSRAPLAFAWCVPPQQLAARNRVGGAVSDGPPIAADPRADWQNPVRFEQNVR